MNFDNWTSRASKHGLLMGRIGLTETQEKTISELDAKAASGKPLTGPQQITYSALMAKKLNPELPQTAQSELRNIYREVIDNRSREYTNKQIQKGNKMQGRAIDLLGRRVELYLFEYKGERRFNKFFQGMPDVAPPRLDTGFDTKCSWDRFTFPWADDVLEVIYEWQNLIYMDLFGKDRWVTAKCLVNCTEHLLMNAVIKSYHAEGRPDLDDPDWIEKKKKIERNMIFDMDLFLEDNRHYSELQYTRDEWYEEGNDMPEEKRCILFVTERDEDKLAEARERVILCREYLNGLSAIEKRGMEMKIKFNQTS